MINIWAKALQLQEMNLIAFDHFAARLDLVSRGNDLAKCASMLNEAFAHTCLGSKALAVRGNEFAALRRFPMTAQKLVVRAKLKLPGYQRLLAFPGSQRTFLPTF